MVAARWTCLITLGVLCAVAPASLQTPSPQAQAPVFRARTDIVRIDVTVLGPDGKPAKGLKREDFTLLEDGEQQEILGFGEIDIPDASAGPAWLRESTPDVRSALDGRVFVFILDDAQTPYRIETTTWIETVKRITGEVIDRMGPQDVAAVICTYDNRCDQDFTNDHARLKAAIGRFNPKDAYIALRVSAGITQSLAKYLRTEPGRRRTIIYVTPRMPARPAVWPPSLSGGGSLGGGGGWGGTGVITEQQMIRTFEEAMRSGITVYGLNLAGLRPMAMGGRVPPVENSADTAATTSPEFPTGGTRPRFSAPPRSLALETGGFIISRPEQLIPGVEQIIQETGSYYLLGYEQPKKKDTGYNMLGGFRAIDVRVNKPGFEVKTHRGYIAVDPPKTEKNPPPAATKALQGILPKIDLPLTVAVAPFAVPGQSEAVLTIALGVREPSPAARTTDRLDIQARSFTQGGEARAGIVHKVDAIIPVNLAGDVLFDVLAELRLKPGVYALRFSADSARLGVSGSVYADVEIPDFARAPLSLSGVLVSVKPRPLTLFATDALRTNVPAAPTTLRTFTKVHEVDAFVRIYQGGKGPVVPVTISTRILDAANVAVVDRTSTLAVGLFAGARSADITVDVPTRDLSPGLYLLRIHASAGKATARRDVTFRIN